LETISQTIEKLQKMQQKASREVFSARFDGGGLLPAEVTRSPR